MDGVELTERLIGDIERSLDTRNSVPDVFTQIDQINIKGADAGNFVGALNAITFDTYLNIIVNLINGVDPIINFDQNDIPQLLEDISENEEQIAQRFQNMLENDDLVSIDDPDEIEPIRILLLEQLEALHRYSGKSLN